MNQGTNKGKKETDFSIEYQFNLYLQRVKLDPARMPPDQLRYTKRVFYGCAGQLLIQMRDEIGALEEEQAVTVLEQQLQEVGEFWNGQMPKKKDDEPKS